MEKPQLINFIAKVMEESGFKVYKNFKTSQKVIDIYAILPTTIGDFGVVMSCKNYDRNFDVGVEVLKEMEEVGKNLKASKVAVVTSSYFTNQAKNYALRKNIKLVDRDNLLVLAKKFSDKQESKQTTLDNTGSNEHVETSYIEDEYPEYSYDSDDMEYISQNRDSNPLIYKNSLYRQVDEDRSPGIFGKFFNKKNNNSSLGRPSLNRAPSTLYNYGPKRTNNTSNILNSLRPLLNKTIVLVILVVAISYLLSYLLGSVIKVGGGISGLVEMIVALLLSYGLAFKFGEDESLFIVKGTMVFFISLIILILFIIVF